jgi:hypothetical protein
MLWRPWMAPCPLLTDLVTVTATDLPALRRYMRVIGGEKECGRLAGLVRRLGLHSHIFSNSVARSHNHEPALEGRALNRGAPAVFPFRVPYVQLRALLAEAAERDFFVEYSRRGQRRRFELRGGAVRPGSDARLRQRVGPAPVRKWLFSRSVHVPAAGEPAADGVCYH